jgi:hypothetical protein
MSRGLFLERPDRHHRVSWEELKTYLHGGVDPTPLFYDYLLSVSIVHSARVLDLTVESPAFFDSLGHDRRIRRSVVSRHPAVVAVSGYSRAR